MCPKMPGTSGTDSRTILAKMLSWHALKKLDENHPAIRDPHSQMTMGVINLFVKEQKPITIYFLIQEKVLESDLMEVWVAL